MLVRLKMIRAVTHAIQKDGTWQKAPNELKWTRDSDRVIILYILLMVSLNMYVLLERRRRSQLVFLYLEES